MPRPAASWGSSTSTWRGTTAPGRGGSAEGFDTLRVEFGIYPEHLDRAIAEGLRTGDGVAGAASDLARVGSLKVITDGSLGTRTAACSHAYPGDPLNHGLLTVDPATLVELMTAATGAGLSCAIHAIGDVANSYALDAFAVTGATGTIEHAQLVAHADIPRFARLGVAASVQPEHALDDRDLTDTIWAEQTALAYPLGALARSGANLLLGSDAPVSPLDPWAALAGAVFRTRDGREPWHADETLDFRTALGASTHGGSAAPSRLEPGARADLVLCDRDPAAATEPELRTMAVRATLLEGRLTHRALTRDTAEPPARCAGGSVSPRSDRAYAATCAKRNQRSFSSTSLMPMATSWLDRSTSSRPSMAACTSAITTSMSAMTARTTSSHWAKPAGTCVVGRLVGDGVQPRVDGEPERDDPLGCLVGAGLRVRHDRVEQFVDRDEVRATHVPVRLLAVHGEGLQPERDGGEELCRSCRRFGVG